MSVTPPLRRRQAPAQPPSPRTPLPAYVLHRYDWSESSLILELFTREQGRVAVVAKGAKRPYSQLRPVLLPFQRSTSRWAARRPATSAEVQHAARRRMGRRHADADRRGAVPASTSTSC